MAMARTTVPILLIIAMTTILAGGATPADRNTPRELKATSAQDKKPEPEWGTRTTWTSDVDLGPQRNLSAKEQLRIRVAWDKPKRVVNHEQKCYELEISGKVSLLEDDGTTLKAINWALPICVILHPRPDEKPDWTQWRNRQDSCCSELLVCRSRSIAYSRSAADGHGEPMPLPKLPDGVFVATFDLSEIESAIGATKPFQVGLCLGERDGRTICWRSSAPILPQTLQMVQVAGPKPLGRSLQLINACPTPLGWDYDPIALVRAANHLRSLGKEKAIAALREFLQVAHDTGYGRQRTDPANIDTSNQWSVASLIELVFDNPLEDRGDDDCIKIWQGIPFHTAVISGTSGWPQGIGRLVDAAAAKGKLIEKPLRPADNPLEAADSLFEKLAASGSQSPGSQYMLKCHFRYQAWFAIRHLVASNANRPPYMDNAKWGEFKTQAARLKIRWDEERQEYVASEKATPK